MPGDPILLAAATAVRRWGLSRFTMADVARLADVSRQTVYRHYPSREELIEALLATEELELLSQIEAEFRRQSDLRDSVEASVAAALRLVRGHPLIAEVLAREPKAALPYFTTAGLGLVERARAGVAEILVPHLDAGARPVADMLVRLVISHVLTPSGRPDDEVAAEIISVLEPLLHRAEV